MFCRCLERRRTQRFAALSGGPWPAEMGSDPRAFDPGLARVGYGPDRDTVPPQSMGRLRHDQNRLRPARGRSARGIPGICRWMSALAVRSWPRGEFFFYRSSTTISVVRPGGGDDDPGPLRCRSVEFPPMQIKLALKGSAMPDKQEVLRKR